MNDDYKRGYADAMNWKAQNHLEHLPQRTWVGLRWSDVPDQWCGNVAFIEGGRWAAKQLKEKNHESNDIYQKSLP